LQNVFQSVVAGIARFRHDRPDDTLRGWLWTIARNRLRDHFRGRRDHPELLLEDPWESVTEPGLPLSSHEPPAGELHPLLARALDRVRAEFEDRTWQAFWRSVVQGDSIADVAAGLGVSTNSVYKARSRIWGRLREELGDLP
jgi:RNA polymerase sigma-70 factor (ECF subfamily)